MRTLRFRVVSAVILLSPLSGCGGGGLFTGGGTTETGYEPHRLGMSDGARRALYAPKYSPEAAAAGAQTNDSSMRRPGSALR